MIDFLLMLCVLSVFVLPGIILAAIAEWLMEREDPFRWY